MLPTDSAEIEVVFYQETGILATIMLPYLPTIHSVSQVSDW